MICKEAWPCREHGTEIHLNSHSNNNIPLGVELYHGAICSSYTTRYVRHGQSAHVLQKAVFRKP